MKKLSIFASFCAFAISCGTKTQNDHQAPEPQQQPEEQQAEIMSSFDDDLPDATVIRVPVENGIEVGSKAEFRTISHLSSDALLSNSSDAIAEAFDAAGGNELTDDLDSESSANSWYLSSYPSPGYGGGQHHDPCTQGYGYGNNCNHEVEHVDAGHSVVRPVQTTTVYQHETVDVKPIHNINVIPVKTIRVHPTETHYNVHPVQTRYEQVGRCQQYSGFCNVPQGNPYGNLWPTVSNGSFNQYYYPTRQHQAQGYNYYSYTKPAKFYGFNQGNLY